MSPSSSETTTPSSVGNGAHPSSLFGSVLRAHIGLIGFILGLVAVVLRNASEGLFTGLVLIALLFIAVGLLRGIPRWQAGVSIARQLDYLDRNRKKPL